MPRSETVLEGGCACGRVRFRCEGEPIYTSYCHCADCRRHTGAPVSIFVGLRKDQIAWAGEAARRQSSTHASRSFCTQCGSPLAYEDDRLHGEVYVPAGVFDEPEAVRPQWHAFVCEALSYLEIADDLPRYPAFSKKRPEEG